MVENQIPVMEVPHQKAPELESQMKIMDSSDHSFIVREVRAVRLLALCLFHFSNLFLAILLRFVLHSGVSEQAAKILHGVCFAVPELD